MTGKKAILDTSVLICLYHLELLPYLKFFYSVVRVPREVDREFLEKPKDSLEKTRRHDFIQKFYAENQSWFIKCLEYGSDLIDLYLSEPNIDRGEAEVFAQNQHLGNDHEMLLDERDARNLAKIQKANFHGVLHILALMDLKFKVCDYFKCVRILTEQNRFRANKRIVSQVYDRVKDNF